MSFNLIVLAVVSTVVFTVLLVALSWRSKDTPPEVQGHQDIPVAAGRGLLVASPVWFLRKDIEDNSDVSYVIGGDVEDCKLAPGGKMRFRGGTASVVPGGVVQANTFLVPTAHHGFGLKARPNFVDLMGAAFDRLERHIVQDRKAALVPVFGEATTIRVGLTWSSYAPATPSLGTARSSLTPFERTQLCKMYHSMVARLQANSNVDVWLLPPNTAPRFVQA